MKYLSIKIERSFSEEEARLLLQQENCNFLYSTEDEEALEIATTWSSNSDELKNNFPWILNIQEKTYEQIDWDVQWQIHGENYREGRLEIDLAPYNISASFMMSPGPGFGDLSHETTCLTLKLMTQLSREKHVVDIGCGSGVLSLAAVASGAEQVYALDIDPLAIDHTKENSKLNKFQNAIFYELPTDLLTEGSWLLVMNMIQSEQDIAWESINHHFSDIPYDIITSGILESEKESYLKKTQKRGWQLVNEIQEGDWVAFHFYTNRDS